jgi:CheY-like chemotaxis protein
MPFTEKIDVLELLISLLREHENKLDSIIEKIELIDQTINKDPRLSKHLKEYDSSITEPLTQSILVVDDDKTLANSFKLILESVGYKVDTAYTGLQALYKIDREEYDLIVLDLNLPDVKGDELAKQIEENHCHTDIVFITGDSTLKSKFESNLDGEEMMIKPVDPERLLETAAKKTANK